MDTAKLVRAGIWVALLAGSVSIALAARGDLWLDEIWSLVFAGDAQGVGDLLWRFRHDNNHFLNTLYLHLVGERSLLYLYRLPAVASGVGSLVLIGHLARKSWGDLEALSALILAGASYPLLLYFSEARGYGPAIFFSLASYALLRADQADHKPLLVVLFWTTSILGVLSHATFVMASLAFVVATAAHEESSSKSRLGRIGRVAAIHLLPLAGIAVWHRLFLKDMVVGGGPIYSVWEVVAKSASLLLGLPDTPGLRAGAALALLIVVASGLYGLRLAGDDQAPFFVAMLLVAPALVVLVTRPKYLYFRYFVICFPYFLLLLSFVVCRGARLASRRWGVPAPLLAALVVLLLVSGQVSRDARLFRLGRGSYAAALERIVEDKAEGPAMVGADNEFRNRAVFEFYRPRVEGGEDLFFVTADEWSREPPEWILTHDQDPFSVPPEEVVIRGLGSFRIVESYRFSGVSGWNWFLFRRDS